MTWAEIFMWALWVLQVGAFFAYSIQGEPKLAGIWAGYAIGQFFWALVAREAGA